MQKLVARQLTKGGVLAMIDKTANADLFGRRENARHCGVDKGSAVRSSLPEGRMGMKRVKQARKNSS